MALPVTSRKYTRIQTSRHLIQDVRAVAKRETQPASKAGRSEFFVLAVGVAAVPNASNVINHLAIINGVDDGPISDSNPPSLVAACELFVTGTTLIFRQLFDGLENAIGDGWIKVSQFARGGA